MVSIVEKFYFRDTEHSLNLFLKTSNNPVAKFSIDTGQQCCENFGIHVSFTENNKCTNTEDLAPLLGKQFISIKYDHARCTADYYDHDQDGGRVVFNLALKDPVSGTIEIVKILIFNDHNGYYPHSFYVEGFGIKDQGSI